MHGRLCLSGMLALMIMIDPTLSRAEDVTVTQEISYGIKTPAYDAVVAADGCLTNLAVGGQEFLRPGADISRGSYFYQDSALKLPAIARPSGNTITAESDKAAARYEFKPASMTWTVSNKTGKPMSFFIIIDEAVKVVANDAGEFVKTPVINEWKTTTWHRGGARLRITSGTKLWGPWGGPHQVWEALLGPKETRTIQFDAGKTPADEEAKVRDFTRPPAVMEADLTIFSPRDYQVFQRTAPRRGEVVVSGRVRADCDAIEARFTGKSVAGELPGKWNKITVAGPNRAFYATCPLPAGGWYKLEARALKAGCVTTSAVVEHLGVGEVFVGAGQSNSTNSGGDGKLQTATRMVSTFDGNSWRIADDPQPGVADHSKGGSFWPAFGDAMCEKYGVPIGVAVTGFGGTSVEQWQPDGDLFKWMMTRIRQLGPHGFRAVMWHQGESDVVMTSKTYAQLLTNVILKSNEEAGWSFPWIVAQVSYHNPEKPSHPSTRAAQKALWETGMAIEGPDTDTLNGDNRDFGGKGIHFSIKGLKAHGRMWAGKVGAWLDGVIGKMEKSRQAK
ncbi:MAG: sialate O-acetylesterase [bacterium]